MNSDAWLSTRSMALPGYAPSALSTNPCVVLSSRNTSSCVLVLSSVQTAPSPSTSWSPSCVLATSAPGSTSTPRTFVDRALASSSFILYGDSVGGGVWCLCTSCLCSSAFRPSSAQPRVQALILHQRLLWSVASLRSVGGQDTGGSMSRPPMVQLFDRWEAELCDSLVWSFPIGRCPSTTAVA
jgi:hypothetical protein